MANTQHPGLLPHQQAFVARVIAQEAPRRIVLIAPPGTGKATAVIACLAELIEIQDRPHRVLVVAPRSLLSQWKERVERFTKEPAFIVDAPFYRTLQAESERGYNPWDREGLFLTSPEFLTRDSRLEEVTTVDWDVIAFDEFHAYRSPVSLRAQLAQSLWASGKASTVLATLSSEHVPWFVREDPRTTLHRWDQVGVEQDLRTFLLPSRTMHILDVHMSREERVFAERILTALAQPSGSRGEKFYRYLVRRQLASSIPGVEPMLRRAASAIGSPNDVRAILDAEVERAESEGAATPGESVETDAKSRYSLPFTVEEYAALFELLEQIDDSKWRRCEEVIASLLSTGSESVLIFASCVSTAEYLASLTELQGWSTNLVMGSSSSYERLSAVESVKAAPGVMITTNVGLEGMELPFISHIMHYDLPENPLQFIQRAGRVERLGRRSRNIHHYAFADDVIQTQADVSQYLNVALGGAIADKDAV